MLEVAEILDKTTLVLTGPGVDQILPKEQLIVLAVGAPVRGTGAPLVVPKAVVEVTSHAGEYVVARSPLREETERPFNPFDRTVYRRPALQVDESAMTGNPAATEIRIGDPVVRVEHLAWYVALRSREKP